MNYGDVIIKKRPSRPSALLEEIDVAEANGHRDSSTPRPVVLANHHVDEAEEQHFAEHTLPYNAAAAHPEEHPKEQSKKEEDAATRARSSSLDKYRKAKEPKSLDDVFESIVASVAAHHRAHKKAPTRKVNIANVEEAEPLQDGVNTPRSVALCEAYEINPSELAPYSKEHFYAAGVDDAVAERRFFSYEKRRQARMEELRPAYAEVCQRIPAHRPSKTAGEEKPEGKKKPEAEEAQRPTAQTAVDDDDVEMRRQFDAQHQRLLEQERRKANGGAYDSDGHRRTTPRTTAGFPRGTSPRSGAPPLSPGRYSTASGLRGRPSVDQPYSIVKIYSQGITEERPLTQNEELMIDDISEREAHRLDTQERATVIQENKQLMHVESELEKQRRSTALVQAQAEARERKQQEAFRHHKDRYLETAARRQHLEQQRQAKLEEQLAEHERKVRDVDRFSAVLTRRRHSGMTPRRATGSGSAEAEVAV